MEDDQPTAINEGAAASRSHKVLMTVVVCFLVLTCSRIIAGLFTAPLGSTERYLYTLLCGGLTGVLIVVLVISPLYLSSWRRISRLLERDQDSVTIRIAGFAEDTNEALGELGFPKFKRPKWNFVSLGFSSSGLTILRGYGRLVAFFPSEAVVKISMEDRPLVSGPVYPVYSFYVESDSDDPVRLSFSVVNEATLGIRRVPEKRRREKLEAIVASLGSNPS